MNADLRNLAIAAAVIAGGVVLFRVVQGTNQVADTAGNLFSPIRALGEGVSATTDVVGNFLDRRIEDAERSNIFNSAANGIVEVVTLGSERNVGGLAFRIFGDDGSTQ